MDDFILSRTTVPGPAYQLCDDRPTLEAALALLQPASYLIVDCEAKDLGEQGGALSIISLRSTTSTDIFLVDVIRLGGSLSPLFDLLESTEIVKIMFDGRKDFSALYHEFGVHLRNVIDLQLGDIHSRQVRRETEARRISRLQPYLANRDIRSSPALYSKAIRLCGLSQCIREHLGGSDPKVAINHDCWLKRPLSRTYLSYAATDIHLMSLLYDKSVAKGYIKQTELLAQTARYIELWKDSKPIRGDPYKNHGLLPLEILVVPNDGVKKTCRGCERQMSQEFVLSGNGLCCVCKIIEKRNTQMRSFRRRY